MDNQFSTRLTPLTEIVERPLPAMAIEGLLPEKGIVVMQGKPGVGKSFFGLELALASCTGRNAFERFKVNHQIRVLYLAGDSPGWDLGAQARKLIGGAGLTVADFRPPDGRYSYSLVAHDGWHEGDTVYRPVEAVTIWEEPPALLASDAGAAMLEKVVIEGQYELVVLDTLLAMHRLPETDNSVMQGVMDRCKRIAKHAAVFALHHVPKDGEIPRTGTDRTRGATSIAGGADGIIELVAIEGDQLEMRVQKQRAVKFTPFRYYLQDDEDDARMRFLEQAIDEVTPLIVKMFSDGNEHTWGAIVQMLQTSNPRMPEGGSLTVLRTAERWASRVLKEMIRDGKAKKLRKGVYQGVPPRGKTGVAG